MLIPWRVVRCHVASAGKTRASLVVKSMSVVRWMWRQRWAVNKLLKRFPWNSIISFHMAIRLARSSFCSSLASLRKRSSNSLWVCTWRGSWSLIESVMECFLAFFLTGWVTTENMNKIISYAHHDSCAGKVGIPKCFCQSNPSVLKYFL